MVRISRDAFEQLRWTADIAAFMKRVQNGDDVFNDGEWSHSEADAAARNSRRWAHGSDTCVGTDFGEGEESGAGGAGGSEIHIALPSGYWFSKDDDGDGLTGFRVAIEIDTVDYTTADFLCEGGES